MSPESLRIPTDGFIIYYELRKTSLDHEKQYKEPGNTWYLVCSFCSVLFHPSSSISFKSLVEDMSMIDTMGFMYNWLLHVLLIHLYISK